MIYVDLPNERLWDSIRFGEIAGENINSYNRYLYVLDGMKDYFKDYGLEYKMAGSTIKSLEPGQWCIQAYQPNNNGVVALKTRRLCFHEDDVSVAVLFKLRWL